MNYIQLHSFEQQQKVHNFMISLYSLFYTQSHHYNNYTILFNHRSSLTTKRRIWALSRNHTVHRLQFPLNVNMRFSFILIHLKAKLVEINRIEILRWLNFRYFFIPKELCIQIVEYVRCPTNWPYWPLFSCAFLFWLFATIRFATTLLFIWSRFRWFFFRLLFIGLCLLF